MNLLVYSPLSLRFGGGFERWILNLVPRLERFGVYTKILCTESTVGDVDRISLNHLEEILSLSKIDYFEIPSIKLSLPSSNSPIPNLKVMKKILSSIDYDLLYFVNAYAFQDIAVWSLNLFQKKPIIAGQHAVLFHESKLHNLYIKTIGKCVMSKFFAHHVLNPADSKFFNEWGFKNIHCIPIGIDVQKFKPLNDKNKSQIFTVLFVGRFTMQKGIDILVKSIELLNSKDFFLKNIHFIFVGSGCLEPLVRSLAIRYGNVNYLGNVDEDTLINLYASCDLFVMPSRRETFGIVALEAQSSGVPVIATNISGPRDVIINDFTGKLFSPEDFSELASIIKSYYFLWQNNYDKYLDICKNARQNALDNYSWDVIAQKMYYMVRMILEKYASKNLNVEF